jgi:hypothetical protein
MANKIVLKKSSVAAKVPLSTDLEVGELAVNLVDQKLYSKKTDGTVILVGSAAGGVDSVNGQTGIVVLDAADVGAVGTITSSDGSINVAATGSTVDITVSEASPASTLLGAVRNQTGATLTKGTVVYISGATGNKALVSKAIATSDATSAQTYGVITTDLANNANGFVTIVGALTNLNTSAFTEGVQLYLSATTAGAYTSTKQYAPNHLVYVGVVTRSHPTQGSIEVKIQNGYEMDELHNVSAQTPSNGNVLIWNATTQLWESAGISAGTGISVTNGAGSITVNNTGVTSVTGTAPVASSGGTTPAISMAAATASVNGYLTSTDWNTFNNKTSNTGTVTSVGGTGTVNGITLTGTVTTSGSLTLGGTLSGVSLTTQVSGTLPIANGGTNATTAATALSNLNGLQNNISQQGGVSYLAQDFNSYPSVYNATFVNPTGSTNLPTGMSSVMSYRFIMGGGDTAGRGFDLVGAAESSGNLYMRERSLGTWSRILHSNNYNSYAPTLTGGGASGSWSINAATATTATNQSGGSVNATTGTFSGLITANGGTIQVGSSAGVYRQFRYDGTMSSNGSTFSTILNSANYNSYAPTLTGGGASGTWGINITGNAEGYSRYLPTAYVGGQQLNPQTYFSSNIGLKVAMTATAGYWSDTLWINGYAGGDVLNMCALHTSRQATPRMWISSQTSNGSSYGTLYEFPTLGYNSGNTNGLYAGMFYDSNDTTWYCDPNSTSRFNRLTIPSTAGSGTFPMSVSSVDRGIIFDNSSGSGIPLYFLVNSSATLSGYVVCSGGSTSYITSSDYRMKENDVNINKDTALAKIMSLRPVTFDWKQEFGGQQGIGFIAHELQAVAPECVDGQKDAVNENGTIKPQGVDTSWLIPSICSAMQKQQQLIEQLTAKVAALEGI